MNTTLPHASTSHQMHTMFFSSVPRCAWKTPSVESSARARQIPTNRCRAQFCTFLPLYIFSPTMQIIIFDWSGSLENEKIENTNSRFFYKSTTRVRSPNPISLVRIGGVKVEDEEKTSLQEWHITLLNSRRATILQFLCALNKTSLPSPLRWFCLLHFWVKRTRVILPATRCIVRCTGQIVQEQTVV